MSRPRLRYQLSTDGGIGAAPPAAQKTWSSPRPASTFFLTMPRRIGIFSNSAIFSGGILACTPCWNFTHSRGTLKNTVQITLSDNVTNSVTINYTGTRACTRSNSNSFSLNLQYAFSAPGGLSIPLPLLDRLRVSFRSELTTALRITRTRTGAVIEIPGFEDRVQSDRVEWRIEPSANYDFGTVTAGMTAIYGWKTDGVNSIYDQKDVGLDVWVMINF